MLKILHNVSLINWRRQEMTDTDGLSFEFEKGGTYTRGEKIMEDLNNLKKENNVQFEWSEEQHKRCHTILISIHTFIQ